MQIWIRLIPQMQDVAGGLSAICHGCGEHKLITRVGDVARWGPNQHISVFTCSPECEQVIIDNPDAVGLLIEHVLASNGILVDVFESIKQQL